MLLKPTIQSLLVIVFLSGCSHGASSKNEMLTKGAWRYEKAGIDDGEASFDALDPRVAGSEKDNTIIFCKDGTGYSQFAHRSKTGNPDSLPFIWAFQNDSTIYFQDQYYKVRVFTPQRLELYADQSLGATHARYTIILRR